MRKQNETVVIGTITNCSTAVTPWNPLLFGCHFVNECAQLGQGARWVNYWYFGGREKSLQEKAAAPAAPADKN